MKKNRFPKYAALTIILVMCFVLGITSFWCVSASFATTTVSPRSIVQTENINLIWSKDVEIDAKTKPYVEFFIPDEQSLVFWDSNFLNSLNLMTGEILWKAQVPGLQTIRLFNNKFFLASWERDTALPKAPFAHPESTSCSSYYGISSLRTYNATTGELIWAYRYDGADSTSLFFDANNVYLLGSNDHGKSESIIKIDQSNGNVISIKCNRWPKKNVIPTPPVNEGEFSPTYIPILDSQEIQRQNREFHFILQGNRLIVLNGITKESIALIDFQGDKFDPWNINIVNQNTIVIIYLEDSQQLFAFNLTY